MIELLESRIAPATLLSVKQLANDSMSANLVATDASGNILVAGVFRQDIDIDLTSAVTKLPNSDSAFGNMYIAKYAPDGTLLWATTWGGAGTEDPAAIVADDNEDVYVAGGFDSSGAGFGQSGTLSSSGSFDVFLIKLNGADGSPATGFDFDGQLSWGGSGVDFAHSLTVDRSGHVIVAGEFGSSNADFNGGSGGVITPLDVSDSFLFRVDGADGAPDSAFGLSGMVSLGQSGGPDQVRTVHVTAGGDIFADRLFTPAAGSLQRSIFKLTASTGAPDSGFQSGGSLPIPTTASGSELDSMDFTLDASDRIVVAGPFSLGFDVRRYSGADGSADTSFGSGSAGHIGFIPLQLNVHAVSLVTDRYSNIYLSGIASPKTGALQSFYSEVIPEFDTAETHYFGQPHSLSSGVRLDFGMAVIPNPSDATDNSLVLRGTYAGTADLDPSNGVVRVASRADVVQSADMVEGFLVRIDPHGVDKLNSLTYVDDTSNVVTLSWKGAGRGHYQIDGGHRNGGRLETLQLFGTDLTTQVGITAKLASSDGETGVFEIKTTDPVQHVGSITLGPHVTLGNPDFPVPYNLHVSGKMNALTLDGIEYGTYIKLGDGLPYNVAKDNTTPDTYNNRPTLTIGEVFSDNVTIENIGDGTAGGVGGGGFGNITIGKWEHVGVLRTTQSIGNFTVKNGDFLATLEIDKFHVGESTTANVGDMTIQNGAWGSSGNEIEGDVKSFNADAFLTDATFTAASIGQINVSGDFDGTMTLGNVGKVNVAGGFDGQLILTDPDASGISAFTVTTDFEGIVHSMAPIKKLKIKGAFMGSLVAPFIASITAYSFDGTTTTSSIGDADKHDIKAEAGGIGTLTATSGVIKNYEITTPLAFKGFNVKLGKLTQDTVGISNVKVHAASIGNISVNLSAAKSAGVNLAGIADSEFVTSANGTKKGFTGSIGNVTVTLTGASALIALPQGSSVGMRNVLFDARVDADEFGAGTVASTVNTLGNVTVKLNGQGGASLGLDHVVIQADKLGATAVTVNRGKTVGATARGVEMVRLESRTSIGNVAISGDGDSSAAQATDLMLWAGGTIGKVSVAAKTAAFGTWIGGYVEAGQALNLTGAATAKEAAKLLSGARLASVTVTGDLNGVTIAAGSDVGPLSVGHDIKDSVVLAGSMLGADRAVGGADDAWQRAAAIASVTAKGKLEGSSIVAGVSPGNGVFGDGDDVLATAFPLLTQSSKIGPVTIGSGARRTDPPAQTHQFAIQAAAIAKLVVTGSAPVTDFSSPSVFEGVPNNAEDDTDVLIRLL